ncbi:unnamed protein product [Parascedosporium putredinis]|uniref:Protein kinase domain-containing protein n=1 Tax=Parascedosporium putredinis TaxID=1442378 RepID=A0A9P1M858_9PEZI|nr:unnamed protein product [Parascedosporium putredinis]CAI7989286.1 unnamed protein product [Parascedosporium putredinis]
MMDPQWQSYHDPNSSLQHQHQQSQRSFDTNANVNPLGYAPNNSRDYPSQTFPQAQAGHQAHQVQVPAQHQQFPIEQQYQQQQQQQHQPQQHLHHQPAPPLGAASNSAGAYSYPQYNYTTTSGGGTTSTTSSAASSQHQHPTPSLSSNSSSSITTNPQSRDVSGDVAMQDANDSHAGIKYAMRPHHQSQLSGSGRPANLHSPQEPSSAAQRYSPMEALSPTSPYAPKGPAIQNQYGQPIQRQSPTRQPDYHSQSPYHPSRQPQVPSGMMYSPHDISAPRCPHSLAIADAAKRPVPQFRTVRSPADLRPVVNNQPAFRRAAPEGGFISPLQALTVHLPATYRICNPGFKYESSRNPRRVLTKPSKGVKNDGFDNEDSDYILYVNDILGSEEAGHKNRYLILDVLGQGTFGQVVKCQNLKTQEVVAVKVIKNRTAYFNQSMMEVSVLDLLNTKLDKNDDHHLLRLKDTFIHRQHLCLVFELLSVNLYELIKQNQFRGLSTTLVRVFAQQLLNGLVLLNKARLIHCDLKPENILLKNLESPIIKIIDFGSACDERQTVYTYIQSRFYRSPEVLLGLPYSSAIDMWSLGCIVVELFLGLPLFPGSSEYNQVSRIVEMLGNPPNWMIEMGKQGGDFLRSA